MKNIITFLMLMVCATVVVAQTNVNRTVAVGNYGESYTRDIVLDGDSEVLNFAINYKTADTYLYDHAINLDSTSGAVTWGATVQLQGKLWDTDDYVNIGSATTWAGTTADTTIKFTEHSTAQYYQYVRFVVTGDSIDVDFVKSRIW